MLKEEILDFIVCIRCKGDLKKDESYLICNKCKIKYPIKNSDTSYARGAHHSN